MSDQNNKGSIEPSMFSFIIDLPNICSLAGLACALLGIYFAVLGNFNFAIIGVLWATLFDWGDGIIARNLKGRTKVQGTFGGQLDSLIDIISFGVFPAVFLLSYGKFNPLFLPGAFILIGASSIRLSYFNIYGLIDKNTYKGLALDNNVLILALLFIFERWITYTQFTILLYGVLIILPILNLSSIHTHKFDGKWVYVLIGYVVGLSIIYSLS